MTMQMDDYIRYKNRKYTLIDCTSNLIETAPFELDSIGYSTACRRGYTAEYSVENDVLYGIKCVTDSRRESDEIRILEYRSECMKMDYSGSLLIAGFKDDLHNADFIDSFLDAETAYELIFEKGNLKEEILLKGAIEEWKTLETQLKKENREKLKQKIYKDEYEAYRRIGEIKEGFVRDRLKYKYCSYKWIR